MVLNVKLDLDDDILSFHPVSFHHTSLPSGHLTTPSYQRRSDIRKTPRLARQNMAYMQSRMMM
jgi:hypothetical protein